MPVMHGFAWVPASVVCCCLLASNVRAEPPGYITAKRDDMAAAFGATMTDRIFSEALTAARLGALAVTLKDIPGLSCPADASGLKLYDIYPMNRDPAKMSWIERYTVDCGQKVRRALFWFREGQNAKATPMAPGESIADVPLQVDAIGVSKATAAQAAPNDCKEMRLIDTAVTEQPSDGPKWKERWTYQACGAVVPVDIDFTPAPDGGTLAKASVAEPKP